MGNCCTNEPKAEIEGKHYSIGTTPREAKKLVSNIKSNDHTPQSPIKKVENMNKFSPEVEKILKQLKKIDRKKEIDQKNRDLPELGPYLYPEGETYIGQYYQGDREGYGTQVWPDGSIYEGYFLENKFSGYGRFIHKEGDYYIGNWKDGMADGDGKLVHVDGSLYEGNWVMDEKSGKGKQIWIDGSSYEGEFKDNAINGFGNFQLLFLNF